MASSARRARIGLLKFGFDSYLADHPWPWTPLEYSVFFQSVLPLNPGVVGIVAQKRRGRVITYDDLLTVFFGTHDATQLNRQAYDVGTGYRSIVLYTTEEQRTKAQAFIEKLNASATEGKRVVDRGSGRSASDAGSVPPVDDLGPVDDARRRHLVPVADGNVRAAVSRLASRWCYDLRSKHQR